jgi:hypothetical protein
MSTKPEGRFSPTHQFPARLSATVVGLLGWILGCGNPEGPPMRVPLGMVQAELVDAPTGLVLLDGNVEFNDPYSSGGSLVGVGSWTGAVAPGTWVMTGHSDCYVDGQAAVSVAVNQTTQVTLPLAQLQPTIVVATPLVPVARSYVSVQRTPVTFQIPGPSYIYGKLKIERSSPTLRFFDAPTGGKEILFDGMDNVFYGGSLVGMGLTWYAEGGSASTRMNDVLVTLEGWDDIYQLAQPCQATQAFTIVDVSIDIYGTRDGAGIDPLPLAPMDKVTTGRFLHIQDPGGHQGRAMIVIHPPQPVGLTTPVAIEPTDALGNGLRVYANEKWQAGDTPLATPYHIDPATIPLTGYRLWIEGASVSNAIGDTGIRVGLDGVAPEIDRVAATVVWLSQLSATVPASQPHTPRLANNVTDQQLVLGSGMAPTNVEYDTDYVVNPPLVLIEDTVTAAAPIQLSVATAPPGVPIHWSVLRDVRPPPDGDDPSLQLLPNPTLGATIGDSSTLLTDSAGSFRVRAFVDINGNGLFDEDWDIEPFIVMNTVIAQVTLVSETSMPADNTTVAFLSDDPAGDYFKVSTGGAINLTANVSVLGGGGDGLRGLDKVFLGWINNKRIPDDSMATYQDLSGDGAVEHHETRIEVSNLSDAMGRGIAMLRTFLLNDNAPALVAPPILDAGWLTLAGTGGHLACLTSTVDSPISLALGQNHRVGATDAPTLSFLLNPSWFPSSTLSTVQLGKHFSAYLAVWTNRSGSASATGDPADRLYGVLAQVDWDVNAKWMIDSSNRVATALTDTHKTASIAKHVMFPRLLTVDNAGVEVRPPPTHDLQAADAQR